MNLKRKGEVRSKLLADEHFKDMLSVASESAIMTISTSGNLVAVKEGLSRTDVRKVDFLEEAVELLAERMLAASRLASRETREEIEGDTARSSPGSESLN